MNNNLCETTKCKYCELVLYLRDNHTAHYQYRCLAQPDAPRVYPNSDCPYIKEADNDNTGNERS